MKMIANLPLLFAGGSPTSLPKMVMHELERFITFMVHCSWGHDTAKNIEKPPWWPPDITFSDPFYRPDVIPKDWCVRLRDLITRCYVYHDSEFLLKFSEELSQNPPSSLQYVDNCDRTTSLYQRSSGRLLVTFRNENMLYDRKTEGICRKSLLPKRHIESESMVEQVVADIYLCDTCDEVFESLEEVKEHEKTCVEQPPSPDVSQMSPEPCEKQEVLQDEFMQILGLQNNTTDVEVSNAVDNQEKTSNLNLLQQRQRRSTVFSNLTFLPFSSLAGRKLNKSRSHSTDPEFKKREMYERYCCAPPLCLESPRWLNKQRPQNFPIKYKKTDDYWERYHVFPDQRNKHFLDAKSYLLLLDCKPVRVNMTRITPKEIENMIEDVRKQNLAKIAEQKSKVDSSCDNDIEFVSVSVCAKPLERNVSRKRPSSNIKTNNLAKNSNVPRVRIEVSKIDIIDLCSDDDDNDDNGFSENANPYPVVCHSSGDLLSQHMSAATPEYDHSIEPDLHLEAAQYPSNVKTKSHLTNQQCLTNYKGKINNSYPLKEFHINLHSSQIISID